MGLTNTVLHYFLMNRRHLVAQGSGRRALGVASPEFWVTRSAIVKSGITTIALDQVKAIHATCESHEFRRLSKLLMAEFFQYFGYDDYAEFDIFDGGDITWDLNLAVGADLHQQFDLIWDNGTIEHVMNVNQALENLVLMTRIGGKIVHTQGIGDQTNAGFWTFSPNFFLDFYSANGFKVDVIQLTDRRKHAVNYREIVCKGSFVGSLIPLRYVPSYYLRQVRTELFMRLVRRFPVIDRALNLPRAGGNKLMRRGWKTLGKGLKMLQPPLDWILGRTSTSGADWMVFVVVTRAKEIKRFRYPTQNVYRRQVSAMVRTSADSET